MHDSVTDKLRSHYAKKFNQFGAKPEGVDWGTKNDDFLLRFEKMLNVIRFDEVQISNPSLLDVGCGYGALLDYINLKNVNLNYTGVDVVNEMITFAKEKNPNANFFCIDILQMSDVKFDYVICNGILTQKLGATIKEMDLFSKQLIQKMFDISNKGIAFNIMSDKVNYMVDNLYYKNPIEMLAMCLTNFSDKVLIDHSYRLYEYTIYIYKRN